MEDNKINQYKDQYIIIPIWFIKMTNDKNSPFYLTPFERELYCFIKGLSKKKPCYAHDAYFASIFNVSVKHVNQSISKLKRLGVVKVSFKHNKRLMTAPGEYGDVLFGRNDTEYFVQTINGLTKVPKTKDAKKDYKKVFSAK